MASARPNAVLRLSAKIDTSVVKVISAQHRQRAQDRHYADGHRQRCGQQPAEHPDQHNEAQRDGDRLHQQQVALGLLGDLRIDHRDPARAHSDALWSCANCCRQRSAYFWALFSPPVIPATIKPGRAVLADQRGGGRGRRGPRRGHIGHMGRSGQLIDDVGADCAGRRAGGTSGAETMNSNCTSPWPNLSISSCVALADSEPGSWKPPADRLLATGMPKMPAATNISSGDRDDPPRRGDGQIAMRCSRPARCCGN